MIHPELLVGGWWYLSWIINRLGLQRHDRRMYINRHMEVRIMGDVQQAINSSSCLQDRTHSGYRGHQVNRNGEVVGSDRIVEFFKHRMKG